MPHWKIKGYEFSFKVKEVLEKYKPAHIHVKTKRGEIEFWLERPNTKIKEEISKKAEKGNVSKNEKSEIDKIVREKKDTFLDEWNNIKKGKQTKIESSSSDNSGGENEGLKEIKPSLSLNLNPNLEEQNLIQVENQESSQTQNSETSSFSSSSQRNESVSFSASSSLLEVVSEVVPLVLFVVFLFMGVPNHNYNFHR